ncbi:MAG: hypothetical protein ACREDR_27265 [Blastocatellia bacterium]
MLRPLGTLSQILTPGAVFFQSRIFIVGQFKKHHKVRTALLVTEAGSGTGIVIGTGDPAPGIAGATIASMGTPVTNAGVFAADQSLPCVVVDTVQLSDGRPALFVSVVDNNLADFGLNSTLQLVGGDTGNPQLSGLTSFSPVKVNNFGTALIEGMTESGSSQKKGLFVLSGLAPVTSEL